jgi:hypothetical protein
MRKTVGVRHRPGETAIQLAYWFAATINPCLIVLNFPTISPGRQEFRWKVVHITRKILPPAKTFSPFAQLNLSSASVILSGL